MSKTYDALKKAEREKEALKRAEKEGAPEIDETDPEEKALEELKEKRRKRAEDIEKLKASLEKARTKKSKSEIDETDPVIKPVSKMDTVAIAQRIKEELNKQPGLSTEKKEELARELFLKAKEDFDAEAIAKTGLLERPLAKTNKWWANLEKTKKGKAFKVFSSTALIGGATLASAALLGIGSSSALMVSARLGARVSAAVGLNMALTSKTGSELIEHLKSFKKKGDENKKNKIFTIQNLAMLGGTSISFLFGGCIVAGVAAGGFAGRRALNYFIDKKIKDLKEKISNKHEMSPLISSDAFNETNLADILNTYENTYNNDIGKKLKRYQWAKNILGGALTIGVGLGTMTAINANHQAFENSPFNRLRQGTQLPNVESPTKTNALDQSVFTGDMSPEENEVLTKLKPFDPFITEVQKIEENGEEVFFAKNPKSEYIYKIFPDKNSYELYDIDGKLFTKGDSLPPKMEKALQPPQPIQEQERTEQPPVSTETSMSPEELETLTEVKKIFPFIKELQGGVNGRGEKTFILKSDNGYTHKIFPDGKYESYNNQKILYDKGTIADNMKSVLGIKLEPETPPKPEIDTPSGQKPAEEKIESEDKTTETAEAKNPTKTLDEKLTQLKKVDPNITKLRETYENGKKIIYAERSGGAKYKIFPDGTYNIYNANGGFERSETLPKNAAQALGIESGSKTPTTTPSKTHEPGASSDHTTPTVIPASFNTSTIETQETTPEGTYVFDKGKGGIQGLIDFKADLRAKYPDITVLPKNIQEFLKDTNATRQAIDLGFYDPNNTAESAYIMKGSSLKYDETTGKIIFHDAKIGQDVEKYTGAMFDSDNIEKVNPEHKNNSPIETARANTLKKYAEIPEEIGRIGIQRNAGQNDNTFGFSINRGQLFSDISMEQSRLLEEHPEFIIGNPFHLSGEGLIGVYQTHQEILKGIFSGEKINEWQKIRYSNVGNLLKQEDPENHFLVYIHKLQEYTGLRPTDSFFWKKENTEHYIARALQKAAEMGKLDEVKNYIIKV